jgi:hypothetical protein
MKIIEVRRFLLFWRMPARYFDGHHWYELRLASRAKCDEAMETWREILGCRERVEQKGGRKMITKLGQIFVGICCAYTAWIGLQILWVWARGK